MFSSQTTFELKFNGFSILKTRTLLGYFKFLSQFQLVFNVFFMKSDQLITLQYYQQWIWSLTKKKHLLFAIFIYLHPFIHSCLLYYTDNIITYRLHSLSPLSKNYKTFSYIYNFVLNIIERNIS